MGASGRSSRGSRLGTRPRGRRDQWGRPAPRRQAPARGRRGPAPQRRRGGAGAGRREAREFALGLLLGQRIVSKTTFLAPPGTRYAHKTGELDGVENDTGMFLVPGRSFAVATLVEGDVGRAAGPVSGALRAICGFYAGAGGG